MRAWPRMRKTIKWGGLAVTALLVVVWVGSAWWTVGVEIRKDTSVSVTCGLWTAGRIVSSRPDVPRGRFGVQRVAVPIGSRWNYFRWWFYHTAWKTNWVIGIPGWVPVSVGLGATTTAWRLDSRARRRARARLCPRCGYDRTGLAPGVACPECNTPAPAPTSSSK